MIKLYAGDPASIPGWTEDDVKRLHAVLDQYFPVTKQPEITVDEEQETREHVRRGLEDGTVEVWSCDPQDIPEWTEDDKARMTSALGKMFGWENNDEAKRQNGCSDEGTIRDSGRDGDIV